MTYRIRLRLCSDWFCLGHICRCKWAHVMFLLILTMNDTQELWPISGKVSKSFWIKSACITAQWEYRAYIFFVKNTITMCASFRYFIYCVVHVQSICWGCLHYNDVIMSAMASQITSVSIVYPTVCFGADQRKQNSASLAFVRGIHRWPVNSPHKGPVTRKMFPFDGVIMSISRCHLTSIGIPIIKMRRSQDRLILIMEILYLERPS